MSGLPMASAIDATEYAAIEATIGASERGRWFLAEHARRARGDDLQTVLAAIQRVEQAMSAGRGPDPVGNLRGDLADMAEAISRTKAEISAISTPDTDQSRLGMASQALDAIVRATEQATSDILGAAEAVQESAWGLRERDVDAEICDELDRHATTIYTACSFQDLTAQRIARIVYTLRYLEDRIASMIAIWGSEDGRIPPTPEAAAASRTPDADLCQLDIDRYIAMEVPAVTAAAIVARPGSLALHEDIVFLPVPRAPAAEPAETAGADEGELAEAADRSEEAQDVAPQGAAFEDLSSDDVAWRETAAEDAAPPEEAWPLPPEAPALMLAEIDALPAEERLALFA